MTPDQKGGGAKTPQTHIKNDAVLNRSISDRPVIIANCELQGLLK